jgi:hypothetical protein
VLLGVSLVSLAACAGQPRPTVRAAQVEQAQCVGPASDDLSVLHSVTVVGARPIYSHVHTNGNDEDRVSGAELVIRAPDGVTSEKLARVLQCHSARVLLGQVDPSVLPDDPYWLPDAWVDIDVKSAGGNFSVTLQADSIAKNLQVLSRATAFADTHRSASPTP